VGQFIGTYKPDGYNTEEELETMGLVGRHDPDFDELEGPKPYRLDPDWNTCQCQCEFCMNLKREEETQIHKDNLARAKLKLRMLGQARLGEKAGKGQRSTREIFNDDTFDSRIKYTGDQELTELAKIYSRYPHNDFLVFMEDGAVVLMDTQHGGFCWDQIINERKERDEWYAEAISARHPWVEIWDIFIPGATQIFTKEL